MCIGTVALTMSSGELPSGSGETQTIGNQTVLVPTVRETEISLLLGAYLLDPHTQYIAYISFHYQQPVSIHFCKSTCKLTL